MIIQIWKRGSPVAQDNLPSLLVFKRQHRLLLLSTQSGNPFIGSAESTAACGFLNFQNRPSQSEVTLGNVTSARAPSTGHTHHRRVANERLNPAGRTHNPQQALQALASRPARLPASQQDCQQATKICRQASKIAGRASKKLAERVKTAHQCTGCLLCSR